MLFWIQIRRPVGPQVGVGGGLFRFNAPTAGCVVDERHMPPQRLGPRYSLLILQRDDELRASLEHAAAETGYFWSIEAMANGRWALERLLDRLKQNGSTLPDLIVTDFALLGLNAIQFVRQLRRYPEFQGIYVALLSSHAEAPEHDAADAVGCDYYLECPESIDALAALLRELAQSCAVKARSVPLPAVTPVAAAQSVTNGQRALARSDS